MLSWTKAELGKIADSDDLHVSSFREDGKTYGTPTWIWSVAVDDDLYVRAYNGQDSRWYGAAVRQKAGRIIAAGMTKVSPKSLLSKKGEGSLPNRSSNNRNLMSVSNG